MLSIVHVVKVTTERIWSLFTTGPILVNIGSGQLYDCYVVLHEPTVPYTCNNMQG